MKLERADLSITFNDENEARNYINSRNVFQFYNDNETNIYSIKFKDNFSNEKINFFLSKYENNLIYVRCRPLYRLKNGKWIFYFYGNNYWMLLLNQNFKIYELEKVNEIRYNYELFEIKEDIFLIYEKTGDIVYAIEPIYHLNMNIFNSKTFNMKKTIIVHFDCVIENIFYLNKYKNIILNFYAQLNYI